MVPASRDTVLRTVRRRARRSAETLTVIGIDDRAFRRGQCYGTLICDLERRRVVALLPDRNGGPVSDRLLGGTNLDHLICLSAPACRPHLSDRVGWRADANGARPDAAEWCCKQVCCPFMDGPPLAGLRC